MGMRLAFVADFGKRRLPIKQKTCKFYVIFAIKITKGLN
jgi:hypothetical protein